MATNQVQEAARARENFLMTSKSCLIESLTMPPSSPGPLKRISTFKLLCETTKLGASLKLSKSESRSKTKSKKMKSRRAITETNLKSMEVLQNTNIT